MAVTGNIHIDAYLHGVIKETWPTNVILARTVCHPLEMYMKQRHAFLQHCVKMGCAMLEQTKTARREGSSGNDQSISRSSRENTLWSRV